MPTEAEWEYSCRGGLPSASIFHFGNSLSPSQANFNGHHPYDGAAKGHYLVRTCSVGSYSPNAFGLWDLHGNVWEWCQDWGDKDFYGKSPLKAPSGPSKSWFRVFRGGGWSNDAADCRSARRSGYAPALQNGGLGFRVALVPSAR